MKILTHTLCLIISLISLTNNSLSAQAWVQVSDSPFYKHHSNGFGFEGKAYIFEGTNEEDISNEVWLYDPETDEWSRLPDFPGPGRSFAIGDDWQGKYYYGFGNGANDALNDLWVFNPVDTSHTQLPSCPCQGRAHPAFEAHNDKILMGTGSTIGGDLEDWWEYDINTQEWTQKGNLPGGPRHHPFQFGIEDHVYVGGGHVFNWFKYNISTEELTPINDIPEGRVAGSQFDHNGLGFLLGGDNASHVTLPLAEAFMYYDPSNDLWNSLPAPPGGSRWACSSFIINDEVYFFGGIGNTQGPDTRMWKFDLSQINCFPPTSIVVSEYTDVDATIDWLNDAQSETDTIKWRPAGTQIWMEVIVSESMFQLTNLEACVEYEYQIFSNCEEGSSSSDIQSFKTDGCCENPIIEVTQRTEESLEFQWSNVLASNEYDLRWKAVDESSWNSFNTTDNLMLLEGLNSCTQYEVQIKSICEISEISFSESFTFFTKDCGVCIDLDYCEVQNLESSENVFIEKVEIGDFINSSENLGYFNYSSTDVDVFDVGGNLPLLIEFGSNVAFADGELEVWIDFNANGEFEFIERVVNEQILNNLSEYDISIPSTAVEGLTKMRIAALIDNPGSACNPGFMNRGEIEDYCIRLSGVSNTKDWISAKGSLKINPTPFDDKFYLQRNDNFQTPNRIMIYNALGKKVKEINPNANEVSCTNLTSGLYFLSLKYDEGLISHKLLKN